MRLLILCLFLLSKSSSANIDHLRVKFKIGEALIGLHLHGQSEVHLRTKGSEIISPNWDQYFEALKFGKMTNDDPRELAAFWKIFNYTVPIITEYSKGPSFNQQKFFAWIMLLRDFTVNYKINIEQERARYFESYGSMSGAPPILNLVERAQKIRSEFDALVDPCNESLQ